MKKSKFKTGADASGTSLIGYINIPHAEIVAVLGKGEGGGDKTLDEWAIEGEVDGEKVVATLYDWKNYGMVAENITDWHIGGNDKKALDLIRSIFGRQVKSA